MNETDPLEDISQRLAAGTRAIAVNKTAVGDVLIVVINPEIAELDGHEIPYLCLGAQDAIEVAAVLVAAAGWTGITPSLPQQVQ